MNHIIIMGRLTADPEQKNFSDGSEYCNFTVAAERGYKSKDGSRPTDFFSCTATRGLSAIICKYYKKGDGIVVEGTMESHKYQDKDGNNRVSWGINVSAQHFPVGKGNGANNVAESDLPAVAEPSFSTEPDAGDLPF